MCGRNQGSSAEQFSLQISKQGKPQKKILNGSAIKDLPPPPLELNGSQHLKKSKSFFNGKRSPHPLNDTAIKKITFFCGFPKERHKKEEKMWPNEFTAGSQKIHIK